MEKILNVDYFDLVYSQNSLFGESEIEKLMQNAKESGFTTVLWRLSVCGVAAYWTDKRKQFPGHHLAIPRSYNMVRILKMFDPLEVACRLAKKYGLKIFAWITVMDEDYNAGMISDFVEKNPQFTLVSKDQRRHLLGALCYWYDEVQEYALEQVVDVSSRYNIDGIYLCTRSHAYFANSSRDLDDFGYNEPVVSEYRKRYNTDPLTESFDKKLFYDLQGEGITRFFTKASAVVRKRNQKLWIGIHSDGYSLMNISPMAHMKMDWEKWTQDSIVDALVIAAGEAILDKHDIWFKEQFSKYNHIKERECKLLLWYRLWDWRNEHPYLPAPVETKNPELMYQVAAQYADMFDGYAFHEALNINYYDLWQLFSRI